MDNDRSVKFWKNRWCADEHLCNSFPSLYASALSKEAWVADLWEDLGGGGHWTPCFTRYFNDWELELVETFCLML